MINNKMRYYTFFTLGGADEYGQPQITEAQGQIKMAINLNSQTTQDNIKYKNATYIGLTLDNAIDDSYIIDFNNEKLKVLYINPFGRYKQVYLGDYAE